MKYYFYTFLLLISVNANSQIYSATSETGSRFNRGDSMQVVLDDCLLTVPTAGNSYSLTISSFTLGIRRVSPAPAIDIAPYFAIVNNQTNTFGYDSITRVSLPAATTSATNLVTITPTTPLTRQIYDTSRSATPTNIRRFFLGGRIMGVSFSDVNNGFRVVNAPGIGASDTTFVIMNLGVTPNTFGFFFFNSGSDNFYTTVTGTLTDLGVTPIKLVLFKAIALKDKVEINWATENELNSSRFELEESKDGVQFYKIGSHAAAGNSVSRINYSFTTDRKTAGVYFYRLKSIDKDGTFTYSNIERVSFNGKSSDLIVYGNPVKNNLQFNYISNAGVYSFRMTAIGGNQFVTGTFAANEMTNIDISGIASGTYILEVFDKATGRQVASKKISKF
jgi:hypothetical protein